MLDEYDATLLREAKQRISVVYNYNYGSRNMKTAIRRLETILKKIDQLLEEIR